MGPTKPVVLLIDHELPMLELYQRELSQDYRVLTCADEKEALTLLTTPNLAALVLEPAIAGGEGWHLLAAILHALEKSVPLVVCSTSDERKRGMEAGAAAFLIKPVLPARLRETLRQVIRS